MIEDLHHRLRPLPSVDGFAEPPGTQPFVYGRPVLAPQMASMAQNLSDQVNGLSAAYWAECDHALRERFGTPENVAAAANAGRIVCVGRLHDPLASHDPDGFVERLEIDGEIVATLRSPAQQWAFQHDRLMCRRDSPAGKSKT